ncbi:MAG: hypothetical protein DYG90_00460 [Chloroflexi bacterium CFX6]|nr:hypothetical protein [Chloroflexi bacterium CFX6]
MSAKAIVVPEEVIRAYDVIRNVRAAGRVNTSDHSHAVLLECIERQQEAMQALFRLIADLQRAERRRQAAEEPIIAASDDVPGFLRDRVKAGPA